MKKIDIVDIKNMVKKNKIRFELKDNYIYLKDLIHDEQVIVGEYEENEQEILFISPYGYSIKRRGVKCKKKN